LHENPYIFPYLDQHLVEVEGVRFFKSESEKVYVKFILAFGAETVYEVEKNKELLSVIKSKFDLAGELEEAWNSFQARKSKEKEVARAIAKAFRVYKKESGLSDWLQYVIRYSENIIYVFKPRPNGIGEVFYSVFKIEKGNPAMGIPDKVEPLFAVSADKFIKEWEPLLERR